MLDKIPTPPTDNLYKFFTAAGLLLMLSGIAGVVYLRAQYTERRDARSKEHADRLSARYDRDSAAASLRLEAKLDKLHAFIRERATVRQADAILQLDDQ